MSERNIKFFKTKYEIRAYDGPLTSTSWRARIINYRLDLWGNDPDDLKKGHWVHMFRFDDGTSIEEMKEVVRNMLRLRLDDGKDSNPENHYTNDKEEI